MCNIEGSSVSDHSPHPWQVGDIVGPSFPNLELLSEFADGDYWQLARRVGEQFPPRRYRMVAVIWGDDFVHWGYSHQPDEVGVAPASPASSREPESEFMPVHAEIHALRRAAHLDLRGSSALVFGINRSLTGSPWSCCCCLNCARALAARGISQVTYPERRSDGGWMVRSENPEEMMARWPYEHSGESFYARHLRLSIPRLGESSPAVTPRA